LTRAKSQFDDYEVYLASDYSQQQLVFQHVTLPTEVNILVDVLEQNLLWMQRVTDPQYDLEEVRKTQVDII